MSELADIINGFNEAQVNRFNQSCTSKIYEDANLMLSVEEQDDADDAADQVNELSNSELELLIPQLSRKLSSRPC